MSSKAGLFIFVTLSLLALVVTLSSTRLVAAYTQDTPAPVVVIESSGNADLLEQSGPAMAALAVVPAPVGTQLLIHRSSDALVAADAGLAAADVAGGAQSDLSMPFVLLVLGASGVIAAAALVWRGGVL